MGATRIVVWIGFIAACTEEPAPATLFISDYRANAIVRYDGNTGELVDVFAEIDRPASIQPGPDGELYTAGFGRGDVSRYADRTPSIFFYDTTVLEEPMQLAWDRGELLVLGNDTQNMVVIDPAGQMMRQFGYPTMRGAQDFVVAPTGEVFVATEAHPELGSAIQVWDRTTGTLLRHFGSELAFASGIALADGVLYATDFERNTVTRFDPETGQSLGILVADLHSPARVHVGPDGALYVLDSTGLLRFDRETGAFLGVFASVGDGVLQRPLGFTFVAGMAP
ncbi:MAG: hypothetical protein ABI867_25355 [Kofleriaceae bacterium]